MPNHKLRWGLLSTAKINDAVIPGLQSSELNELYAVASRSQSKAEDYAQRHNIPRAFSSYEDMINDPNIDVIYNALPNHLHREWSVKAAQRGIHTLCEKPLALSAPEVLAMMDASRSNGVVIMEAFMYRHHPRTHKVMDIINQGLLGEIRFMRGTFTYPLSRPDNYRWKPEFGGGGLWDVGCYPISYAMMIMGGPPSQVFGWQKNGETGIDEIFTGQLDFPNGIFAQFDCATNTAYHTYFEIHGSKGNLFIAHPFTTRNNDVPILLRTADNESTFTFDDVNSYKAQTENMAQAVLGEQRPRITLDESLQINKTITALFESAHSGKAIQVM